MNKAIYIALIIALYTISHYAIKVQRLEEQLRVSNSIINCLEWAPHKAVRGDILKKEWNK